MTRRLTVTLLVAAVCTPAAQGVPTLAACLAGRPEARVALPRALREISGLAFTADGRLLTHNDERGEVAEIEPASGRILKAFRLGTRPLREDFEGIATGLGKVFLVTSDGRIFESAEGGAGATVPFTVTPTGLGARCEIEGLAFEPKDEALLLLCKTAVDSTLRDAVTVFRWSVPGKRLLAPERVTVPLDAAFRRAHGRGFRGSALERDPSTGNYLALSAVNGVSIAFTPGGAFLGVGRLRGHAQPEGLAIAPDGRVYVADEGGKGAGTLSIYACGK